jgi:hypothetical protein
VKTHHVYADPFDPPVAPVLGWMNTELLSMKAVARSLGEALGR